MKTLTPIADFRIEQASAEHAPLVLSFIKELAEYERLSHAVVATEDLLRESLFGEDAAAEVVIGYYKDAPVSFALFFHNFSTFLGRRGLYLEDLYVKPEMRGRGIGRAMLVHLAQLAKQRGCGRFEWAVLDWNEPAIKFYKNLGALALDEWTTFRLTGESLDRLAD
ncbi:MAG TPA: GNAT family N-acetyltransferase [Pyrinomonadaceae bacterium]|jgi:GNAT superfamily N-acetyltransferase